VVIVDNNSKDSLAEQGYVVQFSSSISNVVIVKEPRQGLTPARITGIKRSVGELLVFIDDDNFIEPDFLANGVAAAKQYPYLGSWSGQVKLFFEETPAAWTTKYWGLLVHREFEQDVWSNLPHLPQTMPCGAGLFVRREVAEHYCHLHETGRREIQMDRTDTSLMSAGDNDLAACACDVGLGVGIVHMLRLHHYIPKYRTTKSYLLKLAEGIAESSIVFRSFRGETPSRMSLKNRLANSLRLVLKNKIDRQFQEAVYKGERKGRKIVAR
jgi:glycosyltransferase involved in cell wall biosynthesis